MTVKGETRISNTQKKKNLQSEYPLGGFQICITMLVLDKTYPPPKKKICKSKIFLVGINEKKN